jgi:hypothetical protein
MALQAEKRASPRKRSDNRNELRNMKTFSNLEIKQLINLERKWNDHKFTRNKFYDEQDERYLTPKERERILDLVLCIMFKT